MALDMTPEQRDLGKANFLRAAEGLTRRDMLKSMALGTAGVSVVGAAAYFGYVEPEKPVKVAFIGTGDEGGVLIGALNPKFLEVTAVCDIRPSNIKRAFDGDPAIPALRTGLKKKYGTECDKTIPVFADYHQMLKERPEIEAVIIALPLHLHAPVAIDCLNAGKHVLCEKLMAWNISQCKEMIAAAKKNDRILSIGHQRHYSMLYAHAAEVLRSGILGDVKMIRALWHRNNSWPRLGPDGRPDIDRVSGHPYLRDGWTPPIPQEDVDRLAADIRKFGYKSMEELVRWRLFNRTGGGLMAELGSHQLDACSIFLGKVHPLAVMGVGGRFFYSDKPAVREVDGIKDVLRNPRESDDIVAVTYEFPGKAYYERDDQGKVALDKSGHPVVRDREDVVVVTYTSLNTNSFEAYGECVMGSRGTLVVEGESSVMLYPERNPNPGTKSGDPRKTAATVDAAKPGAPAMESGGTWGPPTVAAAGTAPGGAAGAPAAPPSRGYQEEMEDFAYCIRMWNQGMGKDRRLPRCHGTVAMADAIIALSANRAMKTRQRIEFQHAWFQPETPDVPDADTKPETV